MSSLLGTNTFNPDKDIPDLSGKTYIVTGGSAGIGFGIAAHILQHHAESVTILSNKEEHAESALEELKEYGDATKAHWVKCNLEDLKMTEKVGDELASSQDPLHGVSSKNPSPNSCPYRFPSQPPLTVSPSEETSASPATNPWRTNCF